MHYDDLISKIKTLYELHSDLESHKLETIASYDNIEEESESEGDKEEGVLNAFKSQLAELFDLQENATYANFRAHVESLFPAVFKIPRSNNLVVCSFEGKYNWRSKIHFAVGPKGLVMRTGRAYTPISVRMVMEHEEKIRDGLKRLPYMYSHLEINFILLCNIIRKVGHIDDGDEPLENANLKQPIHFIYRDSIYQAYDMYIMNKKVMLNCKYYSYTRQETRNFNITQESRAYKMISHQLEPQFQELLNTLKPIYAERAKQLSDVKSKLHSTFAKELMINAL